MAKHASSAQIKTENDNGVTPGYGDNTVSVGRSFGTGDHSTSHALRFAAWLVHTADNSEGHEDFLSVLEAVEADAQPDFGEPDTTPEGSEFINELLNGLFSLVDAARVRLNNTQGR